MDAATIDVVKSHRIAIRLLLLLLASCCAFGCDGYGEIRERLSPPQVQRFDRGMRLATPCWSCHDITGDAQKIGPPLRGLMGRPVAGAPGFGYSDAMREAAQAWGVWDRRRLDRYLANPTAAVPGTAMLSPGLANSSERADLIFFLEHATAPR